MDDFESTMNLNYFGTLKVVKAALPDMVERRQGEIVLVSSAAAVVGALSALNSRWGLDAVPGMYPEL